MGIAAAASGSARALREIMADRRQAELDKQNAAERDLRMKVQQAQLAAAEQQQKHNTAALTLEQLGAMGQGAEVTPEAAARIAGTPYDVRLDEKATLPSGSIPGLGGADVSDPGGQRFVTLRPTSAQQREAGQSAELSRMATDQQSSPELRTWARARQAGINAPNPESFITERDREARAARERATNLRDFEDRATIQARITEAAARRRLNEVAPRDRVSALRQADAAAADFLDARKDIAGNLPVGLDPETVREQFREEYLAQLDEAPPPSRNTRRVIHGLRRIMPGPSRSGAPILIGDSAKRRESGGASSDPYERYVARQRQQ